MDVAAYLFVDSWRKMRRQVKSRSHREGSNSVCPKTAAKVTLMHNLELMS